MPSFIEHRVPGLVERIRKAERTDQRNADRLMRWLRKGREWSQRFWQRYEQWAFYKFCKYGIGEQINYEKYRANKRLQIEIQRQNRLQ